MTESNDLAQKGTTNMLNNILIFSRSLGVAVGGDKNNTDRKQIIVATMLVSWFFTSAGLPLN